MMTEINMMDEEYVIPGQLRRPIEAWPERTNRKIAELEARLERVEAEIVGKPDRAVVMLYWANGLLVRKTVHTMFVKPDAPEAAVRLLRESKAAWVDAEAAQGVCAAVLENGTTGGN